MAWTDPVIVGNDVKTRTIHINEIRTEYLTKNGELPTGGWIDDPITVNSTIIKEEHFNQLYTALNDHYTAQSVPLYPWTVGIWPMVFTGTDPRPLAQHIVDLRGAVDFMPTEPLHDWKILSTGFEGAMVMIDLVVPNSSNPNTVIAVGTENVGGWSNGTTYGFSKIIKSDDGGLTWNIVMIGPQTAAIQRVVFPSPLVGYAIAIPSSVYNIPFRRCYIYKTIDGGNTWTSSQPNVPLHFGTCIHFYDENNGIAGGLRLDVTHNGNSLLITNNGGATWNGLAGILGGRASGKFLYECYIKDGITMWANGYDGGTPYDFLAISENGGANFSNQSINLINAPYGTMEFRTLTDVLVPFAAGGGNVPQYIVSVDGGLNWVQRIMDDIIPGTLRNTSFSKTDSDFGFFVGGESISGGKGLIFRTANGGTVWTRRKPIDDIVNYDRVKTPTDLIAYTFGYSESQDEWVICKTNNGGIEIP